MARRVGTRGRFFLAYLVLGAAVGTGIGAFVVLLERPGPKPPPAWSSWKPASGTPARSAVQIATHIERTYRLPSGHQLARVVIGAPGQAQNIRAIGVPKVLQARTLGDFDLYDESRSVMYVLCGAGKNCHIKEGKATVGRGTVLRREALELALYTLKYSEPIENVVVFFPPGPTQKKLTFALFFRRSDLVKELDRPLKRTLPHALPPLPGKIDPGEKATVDDLTGTRIFRYLGVANAANFGEVVVLQPTA